MLPSACRTSRASARFVPVLPNPTCARSHIWGFRYLNPLRSWTSAPHPQVMDVHTEMLCLPMFGGPDQSARISPGCRKISGPKTSSLGCFFLLIEQRLPILNRNEIHVRRAHALLPDALWPHLTLEKAVVCIASEDWPPVGLKKLELTSLYGTPSRHFGLERKLDNGQITNGPIRITQLIPWQLSGVTDVKFITPTNSLRVFWCNRWCAPS